MAKIVWIASYPRSGNTWMRFLLANLLYGPLKSSAELDKKIPAIHRGINGKHLLGNQKLLVKTHWSYSPTLPLREDTIGVIYILRHPIDVLASNLQYYLVRSPAFEALGTEEARREAMRRWIDEYIERGGSSRAFEFDFGGWNENVASWTGDPLPYPRLVLKYEDLKAAPTERMFDVARFLGINATETRIADAVARSSFKAMRALEEEEIARRERGIFFNDTVEASVQLGGRFVRRGEVGGQETLLTPAQRAAANARFGAVMARFGYAGKTDQALPATGR
jgi:hypothetical protein